MLTRAIDRGHLDNRTPAFRIVLHAQPVARVQANLFAAGDVEPNTEPPCDHPEAGWQKDLFGDCVYCCTFCGAELPEPNVKDDKRASAADFWWDDEGLWFQVREQTYGPFSTEEQAAAEKMLVEAGFTSAFGIAK